jgi:hypothetical protein
MLHHNKPVFNVIFIPGTVDYQAIALMSLLQNSDMNFRLVGNSLNEKEARLLNQISDLSPRLSAINFESKQIIPHGTLLDLLWLTESHELFCFCDSDLFLFKHLNEIELIQAMQHKVALSSGGRIENQDEGVYAGFKGGATRFSPDGGIKLATSFFCMYRRSVLKQVTARFSVGFEQYRNRQQIPPQALAVIDRLALEFEMFDTGKLFSVLLHELGHDQAYLDIEGLVHIGGMSGRYLQKLRLDEPFIELHQDALPESKVTMNDEYHIRNAYEKSLKRYYGTYFYCFLKHLIGKGPKPVVKATDERILGTISRLQEQVNKVIAQRVNDEFSGRIWELICHA